MLKNIIFVVLITAAFMTSALVYPKTTGFQIAPPRSRCPETMPNYNMINSQTHQVDLDDENEILFCVYNVDNDLILRQMYGHNYVSEDAETWYQVDKIYDETGHVLSEIYTLVLHPFRITIYKTYKEVTFELETHMEVYYNLETSDFAYVYDLNDGRYTYTQNVYKRLIEIYNNQSSN